jgi:murein DD-endopeptidase MepM/ murein hydrolase activator NlpD
MTGPHLLRRTRHALMMALLAITLAACDQADTPAPVMSGQSATTSAPGGSMVGPTGLRPPGLEGRPHPDQIVVQRDETLYEVSRRYDVPLRAIIDANNLQPPYRINTGQSLTLPRVRVHYVLAGDTLYSVSRLWGVDVATLAEMNHLQPPYTLITGSGLMLPPQVAPAVAIAPGQRQGQGQGAYAATPLAPPPSSAQAVAPPPAVSALPAAPPVATATPGTLSIPASPPSVAAPPAVSPPALPPPPAAAAPAPPQTAVLAPPPRGGQSFLWPVRGRVISGYGTATGGTHNDGINIAAPEGTTVVAADNGTVAYAGNELRGYGNLILVKHADGWMTAYAHNSQLLVKRGERVQRGQAIARVGATGAVNAPQLHFEVRKGTRALDPADFLSPGSSG